MCIYTWWHHEQHISMILYNNKIEITVLRKDLTVDYINSNKSIYISLIFVRFLSVRFDVTCLINISCTPIVVTIIYRDRRIILNSIFFF